jgi:hypothetical protein
MNEDKVECVVCGELVPGYDTIYISGKEGSRCHCRRCYNENVARTMALNFEHPDFEPIILKDRDGVPHEFRFRTHLMPIGLFMDAHEFKNGEIDGYEFKVMGDIEEDPMTVFGRLFEKMRRALSRKHIEAGRLGLQITHENMVRGVIQWDDDTGGTLPRLSIDGQSVSWEEFGRMMMTYEGWNFKIEIYDGTEER